MWEKVTENQERTSTICECNRSKPPAHQHQVIIPRKDKAQHQAPPDPQQMGKLVKDPSVCPFPKGHTWDYTTAVAFGSGHNKGSTTAPTRKAICETSVKSLLSFCPQEILLKGKDETRRLKKNYIYFCLQQIINKAKTIFTVCKIHNFHVKI